ncbi:MAG: hypothetical protein ACREVO_03325 [Steroidobacteraceae bacterium]
MVIERRRHHPLSFESIKAELSKYLADLRFNAYLMTENVTFRESIHKYAQRLVPVRVYGELPMLNNFIFSRVDSATLEPAYRPRTTERFRTVTNAAWEG